MTQTAALEPAAAGRGRKPAKVRVYRDPRKLAESVLLWLWIYLGAETAYFLNAIFGLAMASTVEGETALAEGTPPGMPLLDLTSALSGLGLMAAYFVAGFLILRWIYRVNNNAHAVSPGLKISPAWSVGWFFVPFANLIMPFRGMLQAWRVSASPGNWEAQPVPDILRWWWAFWLISSVMGNISFRLAMRASSVEDFIVVQLVDIAAFGFTVALVLVLAKVIGRVTDMQIASLASVFD